MALSSLVWPLLAVASTGLRLAVFLLQPVVLIVNANLCVWRVVLRALAALEPLYVYLALAVALGAVTGVVLHVVSSVIHQIFDSAAAYFAQPTWQRRRRYALRRAGLVALASVQERGRDVVTWMAAKWRDWSSSGARGKLTE